MEHVRPTHARHARRRAGRWCARWVGIAVAGAMGCGGEPGAGETRDFDAFDAAGPVCAADADCAGALGDLGPCRRVACEDGACVATDRANSTVCAGPTCAGVYHRGPSVCVFGSCVAPAATLCTAGPCAIAACDPSEGCGAVAVPDGVPCDADDSLCTPQDVCYVGGCFPGPTTDCDDGNSCTTDTCEPATGECHHEALPPVPCDDGNKCTELDRCADGVCRGPPVVCLDGDPCTEDKCHTSAGCTVLSIPLCDPTGDPCVAPPLWDTFCDDGNACTIDACTVLLGCHHQITAVICDDGDACTSGDTCSGTICLGVAIDCSDGDPCTDEACDHASGCNFGATDDACDDGNVCTTGDHCYDGVC